MMSSSTPNGLPSMFFSLEPIPPDQEHRFDVVAVLTCENCAIRAHRILQVLGQELLGDEYAVLGLEGSLTIVVEIINTNNRIEFHLAPKCWQWRLDSATYLTQA